jgi:hypothetical protein
VVGLEGAGVGAVGLDSIGGAVGRRPGRGTRWHGEEETTVLSCKEEALGEPRKQH